MKTITRLLMLAAVAVGIFTSASASAAAPGSLPLTMSALKAYVWENTRIIQASAWSSSGIQTTSTTNSVYIPYVPTNGMVNSRDVLRTIGNIRLQLSNLYTNSQINFSVSICDKDGFGLLNGYVGGPLAPASSDGNSTNIFPVELRLSDAVWLTLTNVNSAYIAERDQNGNVTNYFYLPVYQYSGGVSKMPYYLYFAQGGQNGELVLNNNDGTQTAYALNSGKQIVPKTSVVVLSSVTTPGFYYAENTNQYWIHVTKEEYDQQLSPVLQYVNSTANNIAFLVGADLPSGEQHMMVRIWKQGTTPPENGWVRTLPNGPWSLLGVPPGYWWVEYKFASGFGENLPLPQPYNNYGGEKGTPASVSP